MQLQPLREAKAKLPRDTLLNLKGTGLWKTPFFLIEAGSFQLGLYLVSFAGNPSAQAGTRPLSGFGFFPIWILMDGGRINRHNSKF